MQAHQLQHDLQKIRRRFGRQCRGMGNVFVTLVRHTETHLLARGRQVLPLARAVQEHLHRMPQLSEAQRAHLDTQLAAALEAHQRIAHQSRRLTQGKALPHGKIVNADDPTIAPIVQRQKPLPRPVWPQAWDDRRASGGLYRCPASARGASRVMPVMWSPWSTKWSTRSPGSATRPTPAIHSLAGDLALNDACLA